MNISYSNTNTDNNQLLQPNTNTDIRFPNEYQLFAK